MTFAADHEENLDSVFDTEIGAVDATYRALAAGDGATVQVIPNERTMQVLIERGTQRVPRRATFLARTSQVASPSRTDTFVIVGGDFAGVWVVQSIGARQGATVYLEVQIDELREIGGTNIRQVGA